MIKTSMIFLFVLILALFSMEYFSITLPKDNNITTHNNKYDVPISLAIKSIPIEQVKKEFKEEVQNTSLSFTDLLLEDKFEEALALYAEDNDVVKKRHIENYLAVLSKKNPKLALQYMQMFLEEEANANIVKLMTETYVK